MVHSGQLKSWFIAYLDEFEKWPILDPIGQINLFTWADVGKNAEKRCKKGGAPFLSGFFVKSVCDTYRVTSTKNFW